MKKIIALGPGHSVRAKAESIKNNNEYEVLAFQRTFPHCLTVLGIEPDYWTATDPFAFLEGLEYITNKKHPIKTQILIPDVFTTNTANYRLHFGTTPLLRQRNGWETLQGLLELAKQYCKVETIPVTTTKYLSRQGELPGPIFGQDPFFRFMSDKIIIGSVPFDSESVIGTKFIWGLENKLSSSVFPICSHIRAEEVCVIGFDLYGPRFYSSDSRHPWNDETQKDDAISIPLGIIKKWTEWTNLHNMKIYSASDPNETLLSKVLETKEI